MYNRQKSLIVLSILLLIAVVAIDSGTLAQKSWKWSQGDGSIGTIDNGANLASQVSASPATRTYAVGAPRTFHRIQKLQSALLPVMFKLGILASIIVALLFISLKTLLIAKLLLLINVAAILAKLIAFKGFGGFGGGHHELPLQKEIHLHIHNPNAHSGGGFLDSIPYSSGSNSYPTYVSHPSSPYGTPASHFQHAHSRADYVRPTATDYYINSDSTLMPAGKRK